MISDRPHPGAGPRGQRKTTMKRVEAIDSILKRAVEAGQLAGVCVAAATPGGVLVEGAAGVRTAGSPAPMTLDTTLWLASMTKAITAAAAMQLVERGRLALDR